ncbi:methyl-accepting chemotaxis protein [Chromatiaceae bacterium AAb-1]|nr:methyl-accepting chemotaxis protein [Chromatiaceae bacterium AAb-1]
MTLKVAHKVILGFGFMAALLLFSSLSALLIFYTVTDSGTRVNQLAVPAQQQSNAAQIQLLKLAKLSALGYTAESAADIRSYQQNFKTDSLTFNQQLADFSRLTANEPALQQPLTEASAYYQQYATAVESLFNAKLNALDLQQKTQDELTSLEQGVDAAGATLLDLSYIELPDQDLTELIAGYANRIDGQLLALINTLRETAAYQELSVLQNNQDNIPFALSDMQANIDYMASLISHQDAQELWQQFTQQLQQLTTQLQQPDSLLELKQQQLHHQQQARQQLNTSEQQAVQAIAALDKLLAVADNQFITLQQEVSDALNSGSNRTLVLMLILILLAAVAAYLTINAMLRPLAGINRVLGYIAQGDLSRKLAVEQQDEFGALAGKVNALTSSLSTLITGIQQNAIQLSNNATLSQQEVSEISHALQLQQQQIDRINSIVQQLAQSTAIIAARTADTDQAMQQAFSQSEQIDIIAGQNNQLITTLATRLTSTSQLMDEVNNEATNIGGILAIISGIAGQTNLLALNAAIEAARAGEQGRGFAVVADEVRSLAGRTQQATDEIRTLTEKLQQLSQQAVHAVQSGKTDADSCVTQTLELTSSLRQVTQAIADTRIISNQVSEATHEQQKLGKAIEQNMQAMIDSATNSSTKAERTMQHSDDVASLAEQLKNATSTFRI